MKNNKNKKFSVYLGGIAFHCIKCGFCCDAPTVTKKDLGRIAGYLKIPLNEVIKRYVKFFNGYIGELKEIKGKCIFFDNKTRKCKIYKVRPLICRFRPYSIQLRDGKLTLTYDIWFLRHCKGLYIGEGDIEEKYFKYAELVLKYLGFEKDIDEKEFKNAKERLFKDSLKY
ncbi:YkgJ family cysteine cluster protein [Methanocaldococcus sp.]|uniref:YkgJ family cysteine cluster protein n=1 Tax=Methanocaldococcus sp. TaxID=2152917 RepID=UPI00260E16A8|nr:YkgJ family cysteine cluster protein [Methanocaldococcus sp.]MCQ6254016.1 YkgJ family cysteine cluster protein [Methanocaldococcus sp.]